jgi:cell division septum initiation protein DivIVA
VGRNVDHFRQRVSLFATVAILKEIANLLSSLSGRELRRVRRELKKAGAKLTTQAKQYDDKVRDLERKLEQAEQSIKSRTVALEIRERALDTREADLKREVLRVAKVKEAVAAGERQLLQDRLASAAASSRRIIQKDMDAVVKARSIIASDRFINTTTINTASALSDSLLYTSEAGSSGSTPRKASKLAPRVNLVAQPINRGLHRVAKRYDLRSQAVTPESDTQSTSNDLTAVSRIPPYKLRSDGDLGPIALGPSRKENVPSGTIHGTSKAAALFKFSCNQNKSAIPKLARCKKIADGAAKAPKSSAIPVYHLRSAANQRNAAMDLRRAVS